MNTAELFEKCMNEYSHEGEFKINDDTITIFRRCSHEDFDHMNEDGTFKWIEGDEAVGAFVNEEAFFGWYPQDTDDLFECMKEVLEYLLEKKGLKVTLTAKVRVDDEYEDDKMPVKKAKTVNYLKEALHVEKDQIKNIKMKEEWYGDALICNVLNFNDYWTILGILTDESSDEIELEIESSDPNKDALVNMFKYRQDLL